MDATYVTERVRRLIVGGSMMILGLPVGYVISLAMLLYGFRAGGQAALSVNQAYLWMQQAPTQLMWSVMPSALGVLTSAMGAMVVMAVLVQHFFQGRPGAETEEPRRQIKLEAARPAPTFQDDSRYMPK